MNESVIGDSRASDERILFQGALSFKFLDQLFATGELGIEET